MSERSSDTSVGAVRPGTPPIRVFVVDDSVVVRRMVGRAVEGDPALELAGVAPDGKLALKKLDTVRPDVVVLDLEMPVMDGFETLAALRRTRPDLPVIVFSHLTKRGAQATLDAMALGATAFALKPNTDRAEPADGTNATVVIGGAAGAGPGVRMGGELLLLIKALGGRSVSETVPRRPPPSPRPTATPAGRVELVVVAVSTGGPKALEVVLADLPARLAAPVLIVQHMPPIFTGLLAERLDAKSALHVAEATHGMAVSAGQVLVAPGGRHMTVERTGDKARVVLNDGPLENGCRPAADVLFRSSVDAFGAKVLGVVLTGMGRDGMRGAERIRMAGGTIVAQTPATTVVPSMPAAVIDAGLAEAVVPLDKIGAELLRRVNRGG